MARNYDDDKRFFLEVIADLVQEEKNDREMDEHLAGMTREDYVRIEAEMDQEDAELRDNPPDPDEDSPERKRQLLAATDARELLMLRRHTARLLCKYLARVGSTKAPVGERGINGTFERLRILDAEIQRRHMGESWIGSADPD